METAYEVYKAITQGKTLVTNCGTMLKEIDGTLHKKYESEPDSEYRVCSNWLVYAAETYKEYEELKWYEKDISKGVLCRVRDCKYETWTIDIISDFDSIDDFEGLDCSWNYAEPLDISKPLKPQLYR